MTSLWRNMSHSNLWQLRHYRCVWSGKEFIGLCQPLQLVALHLHPLDYNINVANRLVMLFWRGRRYTIIIVYHHGVSPFSLIFYRFPLLVMGLVKENLEVCPCLLVGGLKPPLSDVFAEHFHMCQKGDTFWHHQGVRNRLTLWSCEFYQLFQFLYQWGKRFCGVVGPHHLYGIFFLVYFLYFPVAQEEIM